MTFTDTAPVLDTGPGHLPESPDDPDILADGSPSTAVEGGDRDAVAAVPGLPELVHVDPRTLTVAVNVRTDVALDKSFVASIRQHGVLVPIVARRHGEDLHVVMGQRRTVGAVEAGRGLVPVYIVEAPTDEKAAEILRIVRQLIENDHRSGITDADRVGAHQQLSLLGLSAGQIARRTAAPVKTVKAGLEVAQSQLATAAMARYELTLEQAAVLAEFEDDTEAVKELTVTAVRNPGQFEHLAQRLRDKRAEAAARAALLEQLAAENVTVIEVPAYGERRIRKLRDLKAPQAATSTSTEDAETAEAAGTADSEEAEEAGETPAGANQMTPEAHAGCPGHAAYLEDRSRWSTGEPVAAVYVCTDWQRYGHESRYADTLPVGSTSGGKMTEKEKAERRRVIANNKAWKSATAVRRRWLKAFLARKTPPKDAPQWIAATLAGCSHEVRRAMEDGHKLALDLLGLDGKQPWTPYDGQPHPVTVATETATPARSTVLALGLLLGGLEATTSPATWRDPINKAHTAYFAALQHWGYELSEVEQLVIPAEKPKTKRTRKVRAATAEPAVDELTVDEPTVEETGLVISAAASSEALTDLDPDSESTPEEAEKADPAAADPGSDGGARELGRPSRDAQAA